MPPFLAAMTAVRWFGTGLLDRFGRVPVLRGLAAVAVTGLAIRQELRHVRYRGGSVVASVRSRPPFPAPARRIEYADVRSGSNYRIGSRISECIRSTPERADIKPLFAADRGWRGPPGS